MAINASISVSGHMSGLQRREDRTVGYVETEREGIETAAAELPDGAYQFSLAGAPPQGESDTLTTCRILIDRLNADGDGPWAAPNVGRGVVDCWAANLKDGRRTLEIQVIRAIVDRGFWQTLKQEGRVSSEGESIQDLATHLLVAVKKKGSSPN